MPDFLAMMVRAPRAVDLLRKWRLSVTPNGGRVPDFLTMMVRAPRAVDLLANSELTVCSRRHWPCGPRFIGIEDGSPHLADARPEGSGKFASSIAFNAA